VTTTTESPCWFKSSYSNNGGDCIEVAANLAAPLGVVPVRVSKNPGSPVLSASPTSFASFVAGIKAGEFGTVRPLRQPRHIRPEGQRLRTARLDFT
jgi:hypothetical protein